ncbi:MAG: DUF6044 family protein [Bacteroidota bacterium]
MIISLVVFFLYLSPFFIYGEMVHIWPYDNLNSNVVWNKIIAQSGSIFSSNETIIPNIMGGVPRSCFYCSEFSALLWLYYFFSPFTAYVLNIVLLHSVAFFGAYMLSKKYFLKDQSYLFAFPVALCFALIPFWSPACLSIAGQPLLLYALFNIKTKDSSYLDWLIVMLFPLFSFFAFSTLFFIVAIGLFFIYDTIRYKKINIAFFMAISLLLVMCILAEYRLFISFFIKPSYVSHRVEFQLDERPLTFIEVLKTTVEAFKTGQHHASSLHYPILCVIVLIALVVGFIKKSKYLKPVIYLLMVAGSIMLFYKLTNWGVYVEKTRGNKLLTEFKIERFYTLYPLIWLLILSASVFIVATFKNRVLNGVIFILLSAQIAYLFSNSIEFKYSLRDYVLHSKDVPSKYKTFREFYSEDLFTKIKTIIGKPQSEYRVVNLGVDPAITAYNGFYTLDMYMAVYPLDYKKKFRRIMEKELDKDNAKRKTFDNWGSQCYLISSEIAKPEIDNLELNFDMLKEMNCQFIFSVRKINNASENLSFVSKVPGNRYLKYIYVYKVI